MVDVGRFFRDAGHFNVDVFGKAAELGQGAEAERDGVLFVVVNVRGGYKGSAYVGVDGEIAVVDGETVAKLVGHFVKVLADIVVQGLETAVKARPRHHDGADVPDAYGFVAVGACGVGSLACGKIVGVQLYADVVKDGCKFVYSCH